MTAGRFTVLPDDRLATLRPLVVARIKEMADLLNEGAFEQLFDRTMRTLLVESLFHLGAHEGTIWLLDTARRELIPRFNNGPSASSFVGLFRQNLRAGMVSMVVATELPICENEVHKNQLQDKALDRKLGLVTTAMLAVPFYFVGELRGVISAVQLKPAESSAPDPAGFTAEHLRALQLAAATLSRLIDQQLMALALGLDSFR